MEKRSVRQGNYRNYVDRRTINERALRDPAGFVEESEAVYDAEIADAAERIAQEASRIVLLSGPSSAGKTTTTRRLCACLEKLGMFAHPVEMDNYFLDVDRSDHTLDLESPARMDMQLLHAHMAALGRGEEILIPHFDFASGKRSQKTVPMRLGKDEIAIFEGIHALNAALWDEVDDAHPIGVYLSARMRVTLGDEVIFEPEWTRFMRRILRDERSRGTDFARTQMLWPNVRRGELAYILPNKHRAAVMLDTSLDYELCVLSPALLAKRALLDEQALARDGMGTLLQTIGGFAPLDGALVPEDSLLREFIGK